MDALFLWHRGKDLLKTNLTFLWKSQTQLCWQRVLPPSVLEAHRCIRPAGRAGEIFLPRDAAQLPELLGRFEVCSGARLLGEAFEFQQQLSSVCYLSIHLLPRVDGWSRHRLFCPQVHAKSCLITYPLSSTKVMVSHGRGCSVAESSLQIHVLENEPPSLPSVKCLSQKCPILLSIKPLWSTSF